jgi:hypothetical protein
MEVDALSLLESVVAVEAERAEAKVVDLEAVLRNADALSVDSPLSGSANTALGAVAGVVEVVSLDALIAVASHEVEGVAVEVSVHAGTEAEMFSLLTASEGRAFLKTNSISYCVARVLAAETVASDGVVVSAEGRHVDAEDAVVGRNLTVRAHYPLADSVLDIESLDAGEALAESGVEVETLNGNGDAAEINGVLT